MRPPRPSTAPASDAPTIVTISKFKARAADYFRLIERTGGTIIVTNRGRQVAMVTSIARRPGNTFIGAGRTAIRVQPGGTPFSTLPPWNNTTSATIATPVSQTASLLSVSSDDSLSTTPRRLTTGES